MSLLEALLTLALVNVAVIVLQSLMLWLASRWLAPERISLGWSLVSGVLMGGVFLGLGVCLSVGRLSLEECALGEPNAWAMRLTPLLPYVVFALQIAAAWLLTKWLLGTTWDQAALAGLFVLLIGYAGVAGFGSFVRRHLVETVSVSSPSMAPTVCGVHAQVQCGNCACQYALNMSERLQAELWSIRKVKSTVCPNCGREGRVPAAAGVRMGDNVIADKRTRPRRWDLALYHDAANPNMRYMQRLVGLPDEKLELLDGDVFINDRRLGKAPDVALDMWIPVHDSRFQPVQASAEGPDWKPGSPASQWTHSEDRWTLTAKSAEPDFLVFSGRLIDDLAYNDWESGRTPAKDPSTPLLGDVKIDVEIERFVGDGRLLFLWEYQAMRVQTTVEADGAVEIFATDSGGVASGGPKVTESRGRLPGGLKANVRLSFAFRDGQAYLAGGQDLLVLLPVGPQTAVAAKERLVLAPSTTPCRLGIAGRNATLTLSRIAVARDVYYRSYQQMPGAPKEATFGSAHHPIALGNSACFMLGDNTFRSRDSRFFGAAPTESILGVARWIYWPPERWRVLK